MEKQSSVQWVVEQVGRFALMPFPFPVMRFYACACLLFLFSSVLLKLRKRSGIAGEGPRLFILPTAHHQYLWH